MIVFDYYANVSASSRINFTLISDCHTGLVEYSVNET